MEPVRLVVEGNHEIKSREVTTQGDPPPPPLAMGATPLIYFLGKFIFINRHRIKETAFVEDLTVAEKVSKIKVY